MVIAIEDAYFLGVLSSRVHVAWTLASGGTLEDRPRYNKTRCFEPFPFPDPTEQQREHIRSLGEALDRHRKRQQELFPDLTMTDMYNVLEKLRAGEELYSNESAIHEKGLVSVLRDIHAELDAAVLEAYRWPVNLTTEDILYLLVELNEERQAEERRGSIRWLRPEFEQAEQPDQIGFGIEVEQSAAPAAARRPWPATLPERVRAIRNILVEELQPLDAVAMARIFTRARRQDVQAIADTLVSLNQARCVEGRYIL
jgi:hypothetical protein